MVSRLVAPALLLALAGPGFDGCQGGPSSGPVPQGTTVACFADTDCVPTACEDVRCIANQCMTVATMRDGDLDGHAPPPCGDDCDDMDSQVFPGQPELCDGRDQDCDMLIDEDAAPNAIATVLGTASQSVAAAAVGDSIVITDTAFTSGVRLRAIDFSGHVGAGVPVLSDAIETVDVATTSTGGVVVVGRLVTGSTTDHMIEAYPIDISAGVLSVRPAMLVTMLPSGMRVRAVAAEPVGTSFAVLFDDGNDGRWAWMPAWAAPISIQTAASGVPFDLASDGTSIAVPTERTTITFLSAVDGATLGVQTFPNGLASEPLTVAAHDYIVAFHDAFDHQLAHMTVSSLSPMHSAPSEGSGLPLRVDETPLGPLVTRFDPAASHGSGAGVWALLLDDTLVSVRVDFTPRVVSPGVSGTPLGFDVVTSAAGTAVLTNFGNAGAVLAVLACQPH